MSSRAPFTAEDDALLVKYIAKYNPLPRGRSGNILYQTLCEDVDNKWKWGRTHTWHSWRDRYCKHQAEFDLRIKKYQMKHNLFPEDPNAIAGDKKMSAVQGKRKREKEKESQEKHAKLKLDEEAEVDNVKSTSAMEFAIKKDKMIGHQSGQEESMVLVPVVDQEVHTAQLAIMSNPSRSPLLYQENMRSYPIIDSTPLNSQETSIIEQKRTPLTMNRRNELVNSHLVAFSSKGRSSSAQTVQSSSHQEPSRKADVFCDSSPQTPSPPDARPQHKDLHLIEGPFGMRFAGKRNAGRLADDKNDIRWPLPRKIVDHRGKGNAIEAIMNDTATIYDIDVNTSGVAVPTAEPETRNGDDQETATASSHAIRSPISLQTTKYQTMHPIRTEEDPDFLSSRAAEPVYERRVLSGTPVPVYRNSWTPDNPFRPVDGGILTRRHSFNNLPEAQNSTTRKLDLRVEMAKRRLLASSPFPQSRANSVSTFIDKPAPIQRRRASAPIADEDRERIEIIGLNTAIENIARASGFHVDQIWRVYEYYGSVKRTEEWIRLYQKNSARLQELTHEQMMKKEMGATLEQQETFSLSPLALAVDQKTLSGVPKPSENQLKMKLLPPDSLHLSVEYSPPQETRAGEYNRLVFQGRTKEAISREHARASGNSGVFPRIRSRPSTSMSVQSSSGNGGGETLQGDVNRIREERDVAEQLLNDGSAGSGHQSGLSNHEEMVLLSAHGGITAELQTIEKRMGSDYMLRWLASRLSEIKHRSSSLLA